MAGRRPRRGGGGGLLRPKPRPKGVLALDDMLAALVELDANGLCLQWRNHLGGTPPAHLPRWLLMKILACESAWNKDPVFGVIGIQSELRG